jgi:hypothetical protein
MRTRPYQELLGRIHRHLRPRTYLEIGVHAGRSLALALPETRAVAIDPEPRPFVEEVKCSLRLFETTSDDFFARQDLDELLGSVDLAFIDGMHLFEFALRDFTNIERFVHRDSVVLIHDCNPIDEVTSRRERETKVWTGDVWKLIPILREYRPDLTVAVVNVSPSGLGVVTGLNSQSTALTDHYAEICKRFRPLGFEAIAERRETLNLVNKNWDVVRSLLPGTDAIGSDRAAPRDA